MIEISINSTTHRVDVEPDTPLLWVIRDTLNLTGTKYGCGIQQCGACTVLIKGRTVRSCGVTIEEVAGKEITTIEGLSEDNSHPVQQAWIAEQVPQCGYCQSGQILTAVSLLQRNQNPSDQLINRAMNGLCRCGTYPRIRKAIHKAGEMMEKQNA
ncbi:MAG: (2Fe-2S)-binding protein [SAR324 cluster bacterium]|nr:(2Fe-2S)-binding protein [SAR324 cluster bacterium]